MFYQSFWNLTYILCISFFSFSFGTQTLKKKFHLENHILLTPYSLAILIGTLYTCLFIQSSNYPIMWQKHNHKDAGQDRFRTFHINHQNRKEMSSWWCWPLHNRWPAGLGNLLGFSPTPVFSVYTEWRERKIGLVRLESSSVLCSDRFDPTLSWLDFLRISGCAMQLHFIACFSAALTITNNPTHFPWDGYAVISQASQLFGHTHQTSGAWISFKAPYSHHPETQTC